MIISVMADDIVIFNYMHLTLAVDTMGLWGAYDLGIRAVVFFI